MNISSKDLINFVSKIQETEVEVILDDDFWQDISFQGFNAENIIRSLINKGGDSLSSDMCKLIAVGLQRGNNFTKFSKTMSGYEKIKPLIQKYDIKPNILSSDDRKNTITLSRIVSCFPLLAGSIIQKADGHVVRPQEISENMPIQVCFPGFASLVPLNKYNELMILHEFYLFMVAKKIANQTNRKHLSEQEMLILNRRILLGSRGKAIMSNENKIKTLKEWGLIDANDVVPKKLQVLSNHCKNQMDKIAKPEDV
jgi:hypothetical protein